MNMIYNSVLPYSLRENIAALDSLCSIDKQILRFESKLSEYAGKYAVALDSGLSAIIVFLRLKGLSCGDEIAVPAYLCERVGLGLLAEGYRLNFIDVDDNYNISLSDLEKKISVKTKAVIVVHSYGIACDVEGARDISKKYGAIIVEDSAQSFGGRLNGKLLGTIGDGGVYSFGWFKPMTAMGGGALISNNKAIIEKAKEVVANNFKIREKIVKLLKSMLYMNNKLYYKIVVSSYSNTKSIKNKSNLQNSEIYNVMIRNYIPYRIQNIQASIGAIQINKADEFNRKRIINTRLVIDGLSSLPIKFPPAALDYPLLRLPALFYTLDHSKIVEVSNKYHRENVDVPMLYPHLPDILGLAAECQNAKYLSKHTLHLPVHPCLTLTDVNIIVRATKKLLALA